jgi:hypothetical protein
MYVMLTTFGSGGLQVALFRNKVGLGPPVLEWAKVGRATGWLTCSSFYSTVSK